MLAGIREILIITTPDDHVISSACSAMAQSLALRCTMPYSRRRMV
jgi:hypothetical protein